MLPGTTVPFPIDRAVLNFCSSISANAPRFVNLRPEPWALQRECFPNVARKVQASGGKIIYGWVIWRCKGFFIEAEHHCVYEARPGKLVDITPQRDGEARVLFLRDDDALYDFASLNRRDNVRQALIGDVRISRLMQLFARKNEILNSTPAIGGLVELRGDAGREMLATEAEIGDICAQF